jgi:16S rRNA G527 N7-methylase RsmG
MKGPFDMVISRALSDTQTFLKLSAPFLEKGGRVLAMKADVSREEMQRHAEAEGDRYELLETVSLVLPFSSFKRSILIFEKQ